MDYRVRGQTPSNSDIREVHIIGAALSLVWLVVSGLPEAWSSNEARYIVGRERVSECVG